MRELSLRWPELNWIGFDTETTGKYPLEAELCEVGAVIWRNGKVEDEFQTLICPSCPMGPEVIKIHNITNEMVAEAPPISEVLPDFLNFISQGILVAHHAPFDMGFLALEIEKAGLQFPRLPVVCSSRLARKVIKNVPNHKLQTLVRCLQLEAGRAHRALDDARNCLEVALHCFNQLGVEVTLDDILKAQDGALEWIHYSLEELREKQKFMRLLKAIHTKESVMLTYSGGSRPGTAREVFPKGVVRNPDGDFLVASEDPAGKPKRYLLAKISQIS